MESSLDQFIAPVSRAKFFAEYWGVRPLIAPATCVGFEALFSWSALSEVLSTQRLDFPRLRLVRSGKVVPASEYIRQRSDRRGYVFNTHDSHAVANLLQNGAVLHLTSVAEAWQPLAVVSAELERDLTARVQVNVHAGLARSRGFDTHWDGHDVFAVQVAGKKRWRFFGITQVAPLAVPPDQKTGAPEQHVWEGILSAGEVLYLPRGFWHAAEALDDVSLHLTFAVQHPTGLDYLRSVLTQLEGCVSIRRDVPFPSLDQGPERAEAYLEELRRMLTEAVNAQSLAAFIADLRATLGSTNRVQLASLIERKENAHIS